MQSCVPISASFHALMQHLSAVIDIRRAHQARKLCNRLCQSRLLPLMQHLFDIINIRRAHQALNCASVRVGLYRVIFALRSKLSSCALGLLPCFVS